MIAASSLAIFIVPVLFVVIVKIAYGKKQLEYLAQHKDDNKEGDKTDKQEPSKETKENEKS
jgi:HAE1 family hydrophobic/amphiphilic exporter-1